MWSYDTAGNILSRTEYGYTTGSVEDLTPADTVNYTYGDEDWGDLLTAYDGVNISYDGIGNPLSDGTWSYTWEHGRELASMTDGSTTWSFAYDVNGLRTSRTNGSTAYNYIYNGGSLSKLTVGNNTLYFTYGAEGHPLTLTHNVTTYFYATNLQGDVVAILNASGNPVVRYTYDAWGNPLTVTDTSGVSLATLNPLRYRGYVFDHETGLYYLQSRYYDPSLGRFLNADAYTSTGQGQLGNNMFAYCGNNPVCFSDPEGADFIYDLWNAAEDAIWRLGAEMLKRMGYDLTGKLLELSASGADNTYKAGSKSSISKKIASDKGFTQNVLESYNGGAYDRGKTFSYKFPVSQGDLGAALHRVSYTFIPFIDGATGKRWLLVTITDTFDFTEMKNPFTQGSFKAGVLWLANDIACIDMEWGLLDPVDVEITVVIPVEP